MAYLGNTPSQQAFAPAVDYFNGNASTVAFTLSRPVASVAQVKVTIENVPQNPSSAFTVSGSTITFTSAPPSGTSNIYVTYTSPITTVIAPGQGTVNTTQLGSSLLVPIASGGTGSASTTYCSLTANVTGILPVANGGTGVTARPAGSVLQVVSTVLSTEFTSATKGSYVAVTGLSVTITPSATSSKIYISACVTTGNLNNLICMFHIYRGGSQITPNGGATGLTPSNMFVGMSGGVAAYAGVSMTLPMNFLDSPASTSALTYQIYAAVNSTATANLNVNPSLTTGGGAAGGSSTITVMEISG